MVSSSTSSQLMNPLLESPLIAKPEEVLASFQSRHGIFGRQNRNFTYKYGAVSLQVVFEKLPSSFTSEECSLFTSVKQGDKSVFCYRFGDKVPEELPVDEPQRQQITKTTGKPQSITVFDLAEMLSKKRTLFFTGAGISAATGIHTLSSLYADLGLEPDAETDNFVHNAMHSPEELVQKILAFYKSAKLSPPTCAHHALARLARMKQSQILTGNFDLLHERSGVVPYRVFYRDTDNDFTIERLQEVDMILCIGMSRDNKGILKLYKDANPHAIIVSINQEVPAFLDSGDYSLVGDLQQLLPELENSFTQLSTINA